MKKILITGFEAFGSEQKNPTQEIVCALDGTVLGGGIIYGRTLPVVRMKCITEVIKIVKELNPDIVIALGQAQGRNAITPEKVAINIDDFVIPDNNGVQVTDEVIIKGGSTAYFSTLPIKAIVSDLSTHNTPAKLSYTAGTYVCNHLFYGLMHHFNNTAIQCGFIHVPLASEQSCDGKYASMAMDDMIEAIKISAQTCINNSVDMKLTGGSVC